MQAAASGHTTHMHTGIKLLLAARRSFGLSLTRIFVGCASTFNVWCRTTISRRARAFTHTWLSQRISFYTNSRGTCIFARALSQIGLFVKTQHTQMLVASLRKLCKNSCRIVRRWKRGWLQALFLSLFVSKAVCVAVEFSGEHMRQGAQTERETQTAPSWMDSELYCVIKGILQQLKRSLRSLRGPSKV